VVVARAALPLAFKEPSSSCCCSNPNEGTLLLSISVCAVSVDVLTHLHKHLPVSYPLGAGAELKGDAVEGLCEIYIA